ncbi:MAG: TonB-dependent receptor [Verrucomicrobia bacterium]|nr:TonB-dependent receptor [Verrucomicrobiota bacterium]
MVKRLTIYVLGLVLLGLTVTMASADEDMAAMEGTRLPPMTVVARDLSPTWLFGENDTVGRALATVPLVLVNSQGGYGVQNDILIRGSSFSGAGLSLAGLSLRNPQTEHFHAELPIPAGLLSAPVVLTGLDQVRDTDGHLVGSVGLEFLPAQERRRVSAGVGEDSRQWANALVQQPVAGGPEGGDLAVSVFGGVESADSVDYDDNDLDWFTAGGHLQWRSDDAQADLVFAHQEKEFGARGYYGVTESLAADEELEDTVAMGTLRWGDQDGAFRRASVAWRELVDDYVIPAVFVNHTRSTIASAFVDGRDTVAENIDVTWRAGVEDQELDGLTLGAQRLKRAVALLLPRWSNGQLSVSAGVRGEAFAGDGPAYLPQGGIELAVADGVSVYGAYTESVRQPSFTELNYESPGSLGNTGLERQESRTIEGGIKGQLSERADWKAAVFHRRTEDTVDWVRKTPESTRFEATNIGDIETLGVEVAVDAAVCDAFDVTAAYTWLDKEDDLVVHASRYALDYAEHLFKVSGVWQATEALRVVGTQILRWQRENPLRRSDNMSADGSLAVHAVVPGAEQVTVSLSVDNVWDDDFEVFAGQRVGGRRVSGGVTIDW